MYFAISLLPAHPTPASSTVTIASWRLMTLIRAQSRTSLCVRVNVAAAVPLRQTLLLFMFFQVIPRLHIPDVSDLDDSALRELLKSCVLISLTSCQWSA